MFELLRNIHREQDDLEKELQVEDKQLNYYREFFKKHHCQTLKNIEAITDEELAIALIMVNNPELDYDIVKKCVQDNTQIFGGNKTASYQVIEVLCDLSKTDQYQKIAKRFALGPSVGIKDFYEKNGALLVSINLFLATLSIDAKKFSSFMELLYDYSIPVQTAINIIYAIHEIKKDRDSHFINLANAQREQMEEQGYAPKISDRQVERYIKKTMNDIWDVAAVLEPFKNAKAYYEKKEQDQKSKLRNAKRVQAAYKTLEEELYEKVTSQTEIKNVERLLEKIPNEQIRLQALKIIYEHNSTIYQKAQIKYNELSANTASRYQVLLAKFGISPGTYEVGSVMKNSIADVEAMLMKLKSLGITQSEEVLRVIKTSDLKTVANYTTLIEKGVISRELLITNPTLFNPTSKEYENFMRNFVLIKEEKINPYAFTGCEQVLTTSFKQFKQGIDTLKAYNLLGRIKTGLDYTFLSMPSLQAGIDTLLELGLEDILVDSIEILNYQDKFQRLQLLKSLNMPVTTQEAILEVLTTDKFIVPDDEIDNYIYNATEYNLPTDITPLDEAKKKKTDLSRLAEFVKSDLTYEVDGIPFSRQKVQRTLDSVESSGKANDRLLYGLIKDTILNDQELVAVTSAIYSKKSQGPVKVKQ